MLIEFICDIMKDNGYVALTNDVQFEGYDFCLFGCGPGVSKEEYFVVMESHIQSEAALSKILSELADEVFEQISAQSNVAEFFKKNSTLIICAEEQSCSTSVILSLEEDQYNFKKNVILFTKSEIESMTSKVGAMNAETVLTNERINRLIAADGGDVFRAFKSGGGGAQNYYSLLLKMVSKVPFLTYIPVAKSLHDLDGAIDTSMTKLQVDMYRGALEEELLTSDKHFETWLDQP